MLYLVHHGEAMEAQQDAQQPLTPVGRAAVERVGVSLEERGVLPVQIWHSGKLRARQTANILHAACNPTATVGMVRGLRPADSSEIMADRLMGEQRDVVLVGHMPHIARLLRRLVGKVGEVELCVFPSHGVVALTTDDEGFTWIEAWRLN